MDIRRERSGKGGKESYEEGFCQSNILYVKNKKKC